MQLKIPIKRFKTTDLKTIAIVPVSVSTKKIRNKKKACAFLSGENIYKIFFQQKVVIKDKNVPIPHQNS